MRIIPLAHWPQDVKYLQIKKADNRYYAFADEKRERIYIPKDWKTNPDIDGYIFHEYRHILHKREGIFLEYYARYKDVRDSIIASPDTWLEYALKAEKDCDLYALEKTGIDLGEYPKEGIAHWSFIKKCLKHY